jgi:PPOX class probable F420-dependent enzyme
MTQSSLDLNNPKHAHADERLRSDIIIWIGTVRPDGRPHFVPVWFLWDEGTVLVFSKPDQKVRNLQKNSNVVLALDDTKGGNDVILIEGEAALLEQGSVTTTHPDYAAKYGQELTEMGWTPESMSKEYNMPIRITPTKIRVDG